MDKPKPEDYGYQEANSFDDESGWMIEGGEEAYFEALRKWEAAQDTDFVFPDDLDKIGAGE